MIRKYFSLYNWINFHEELFSRMSNFFHDIDFAPFGSFRQLRIGLENNFVYFGMFNHDFIISRKLTLLSRNKLYQNKAIYYRTIFKWKRVC